MLNKRNVDGALNKSHKIRIKITKLICTEIYLKLIINKSERSIKAPAVSLRVFALEQTHVWKLHFFSSLSLFVLFIRIPLVRVVNILGKISKKNLR